MRLFTIVNGTKKCLLYGIAGCQLFGGGGGGVNALKTIEIHSGHSELSVITQVSGVEGCLLGGVPLCLIPHSILILLHTCMYE